MPLCPYSTSSLVPPANPRDLIVASSATNSTAIANTVAECRKGALKDEYRVGLACTELIAKVVVSRMFPCQAPAIFFAPDSFKGHARTLIRCHSFVAYPGYSDDYLGRRSKRRRGGMAARRRLTFDRIYSIFLPKLITEFRLWIAKCGLRTASLKRSGSRIGAKPVGRDWGSEPRRSLVTPAPSRPTRRNGPANISFVSALRPPPTRCFAISKRSSDKARMSGSGCAMKPARASGSTRRGGSRAQSPATSSSPHPTFLSQPGPRVAIAVISGICLAPSSLRIFPQTAGHCGRP